MIAFGIIGIGGFARTWVRRLEALESRGVARLAAAVVRNRAKYASEVTSLEDRGCAIYATLEEMLAEGEGCLDVIGVPTGIAFHAPMAIQAMEAGYNVVIEKPVAGTVQELSSLQEAECRTGRWCAVGYQHIYSPTIQWLREKVRDGRLGAILEARSMIGWPRSTTYYERNPWAGQLRDGDSWVLDGPATNATAHYMTDMLYLMAAQQGDASTVSSVRAELYRAKPIPSYDTSCIEVRMAGARVLHVATHSLSQTIDPTTQILCERGTISWARDEQPAVIRYHDGSTEEYVEPDGSDAGVLCFEQIARVASGQDAAPLCGLAEGGPHVLAINLAFESSGPPSTIPETHTYQQHLKDESQLLCIRDMDKTLVRAYTEGAMFSRLGAPWAQSTNWVSSDGYSRFPRDETLRQKLGVAST